MINYTNEEFKAAVAYGVKKGWISFPRQAAESQSEEREQSPKTGLGAAGAQLQGRGRDTASQPPLPDDQARL